MHCALTALFKMLTFVLTLFADWNPHAPMTEAQLQQDLLWECSIQDHVCFKAYCCHLIVHSVAYIFKEKQLSQLFCKKLLQSFSTFSMRRSVFKIRDQIIISLNFKCPKNFWNLCNLNPKVRLCTWNIYNNLQVTKTSLVYMTFQLCLSFQMMSQEFQCCRI